MKPPVFRSNYLENPENKIVRFRHIPENRMIGSLLAKLNLPQTDPRILGGIVQHLQEIGVGHEMRAGTGRKIPAARQSPHGCRVDVPADPG